MIDQSYIVIFLTLLSIILLVLTIVGWTRTDNKHPTCPKCPKCPKCPEDDNVIPLTDLSLESQRQLVCCDNYISMVLRTYAQALADKGNLPILNERYDNFLAALDENDCQKNFQLARVYQTYFLYFADSADTDLTDVLIWFEVEFPKYNGKLIESLSNMAIGQMSAITIQPIAAFIPFYETVRQWYMNDFTSTVPIVPLPNGFNPSANNDIQYASNAGRAVLYVSWMYGIATSSTTTEEDNVVPYLNQYDDNIVNLCSKNNINCVSRILSYADVYGGIISAIVVNPNNSTIYLPYLSDYLSKNPCPIK